MVTLFVSLSHHYPSRFARHSATKVIFSLALATINVPAVLEPGSKSLFDDHRSSTGVGCLVSRHTSIGPVTELAKILRSHIRILRPWNPRTRRLSIFSPKIVIRKLTYLLGDPRAGSPSTLPIILAWLYIALCHRKPNSLIQFSPYFYFLNTKLAYPYTLVNIIVVIKI